jgi:hypothetical protein
MNSQLLVYECEGSETEIKDWFRTINISGVPLNDQELLNAVYSGPFVTAGKEEFSNSQNANVQKWSAYISGSVNRQDYWERALQWVSKGDGNVGGYMSSHRTDKSINEVKVYFNSVIDWVSSVFVDVESEMKGLEWGRLYETFHDKPYDSAKLSQQIKELYGDPHVKTAGESSNICWVDRKKNLATYSMCVFLMRQPRRQLFQDRPREPSRMVSQTARPVQPDMRVLSQNFGV